MMFWVMLLKPLVLLLLFVVVIIPLELAFMRWFPEGRLKRLLLRRIS